jgi:hypothetical protein
MRNDSLNILLVAAVLTVSSFSADASPACLKETQPFALSSDTKNWTMTIAPGGECIQGLRHSYMQIYEVKVVSEPTNGQLVIVGSGFRYYANDASDPGTDTFTLRISGKNRHGLGKSTLQIEVRSDPNEADVKLVKRMASIHLDAETERAR